VEINEKYYFFFFLENLFLKLSDCTKVSQFLKKEKKKNLNILLCFDYWLGRNQMTRCIVFLY